MMMMMMTKAHLSTFCTRMPATTPMVVGRLAAHTPSLFRVFSSMLAATTRGGAHCHSRGHGVKGQGSHTLTQLVTRFHNGVGSV